MLGWPIIAPNGMSVIIWASFGLSWAIFLAYYEHKASKELNKRAEDLLESLLTRRLEKEENKDVLEKL